MRLATLIAAAAMAVMAVASNTSYAQSEAQLITEWRAYRGAGIPPQWTIADGVISHAPGGGDLISVESFDNFELSFEWKISPGGNSGVMYRVDERYGASFQSGPEYQILDNGGHSDGRVLATTAASVPFLYAPSRDATLPVGEWNAARIIVQGNHVEHWLNGEMVVSVEIGSADWNARVAASKFGAWAAFGTLPAGHIVLQDHGNSVEYRNVMVRKLD